MVRGFRNSCGSEKITLCFVGYYQDDPVNDVEICRDCNTNEIRNTYSTDVE